MDSGVTTQHVLYRTDHRALQNATQTLSVNNLNAPKHRLYWSRLICCYKISVKYISCQPLLLRNNYQVFFRNSICLIGYVEGSFWNSIKILSVGIIQFSWCKSQLDHGLLRLWFIIIIIISVMQDIYTHIPETNHVPSNVAAIVLLLFMMLIQLVSVLNLLYFYISTFRSMCAVPNMAVFCSSLTSCFPDMLLTYFLNDFEIVPVAPIITGITFIFTFHMRRILLLFLTVAKLLSLSSTILTLHPIGLTVFCNLVCCLLTRKIIPLHNVWSDQSA